MVELINIFKNDFGVTEKKGKAITSSRKVAVIFNKRHANILRDIEKITESNSGLSNKFTELNFEFSKYKDSTGRTLPEYLLTKDGFTILTMGFTGKKAMIFKEAYIQRFNEMEEFINNLFTAKAEFPEFTDAIMSAHTEPKHYHFSNEVNMINRIVLGMTAKQFKEANGVSKNEQSIRPYLNNFAIEAIKSLQRMDIGLVVSGLDYETRKRKLIEYFNRISIKKISA
ncbi:MAG: Rha family transcriptional regulator [Candidatus Odinarchaeota archaeon]